MIPSRTENNGFGKRIVLFVFLLFFVSVSLGFLGGYLGSNFSKLKFFQKDSNIDSVVLGASAPGILTFQGRITDLSETPITTSSNMTFRLYTTSTGGTALWSGSCSVTPDQDGIFDVILGSTCGSTIATSVFAENSEIYLGITVGSDTEMSPRQRIGASAYALNADTLKGFEPSQAPNAGEVVVLDSSGNLVFGVTSPTISSTGNILISPGSTGYVGIGMGVSTPSALLSVGEGSKFSVNSNGDISRIKNLVYSWPTAHPASGQQGFLQSDDGGNLSWVNLPSGSYVWGLDSLSSYTYAQFMEATGVATLSNFGVDNTEKRLWVHGASSKTGFTVYTNFSGSTSWPVVSFKADGSNFTGSILQLVQDGTGTILEGYRGSDIVFQFDNRGDIHLSNNGVAYLEPFTTAPTNTDLFPNSEGCLYSVGTYPALDIYWDPACTGLAAMKLNSSTGSSLWTDGGTFTYLTSTIDDLVLGSSTTSGAKFFFDMANGRLGIGTSTPQASIDIAGAASEISNTNGNISILPNQSLVVTGGSTAPTAMFVYKTGSATSGDIFGLRIETNQTVAGALTVFGNRIVNRATHTSGTLAGLQANSTQIQLEGNGGTTNYVEGLTSNITVSTGAIASNVHLLRIFSPTNSGTINHLKGILINNMNAGSSSNYSIYSEGGTMYHAGNVGIGTSTPAFTLDVNGIIKGTQFVGNQTTSYTTLTAGTNTSDGPWLELRGMSNSDRPGESSLGSYGSSGSIAFWNYTPGQYHVQLMRILANGRVGIGTSTPRGIFDVGADGDIYLSSNPIAGTTQSIYLPGHIFISPYNGSDLTYIQARRSDNSGSTQMVFRVTDAGTIREGMRILSNGNVSIASPASGVALTVGRAAGQPNIKSSTDWFMIDSTSNPVSINHYVAQNVLLAYGGGRVGIGMNGPSQKLDVAGSIRSTGYLFLNRGDPMIFLQDTDHRSAMIHVNSNIFYILRGSGVNSTTWTPYNGQHPLEINLENNDALFGGKITSIGDVDVYKYITINKQASNAWFSFRQYFSSGTYIEVDTPGGYRGISTFASSQKYKKNIEDLEIDSNLIYSLRPVSFNWKTDTDDTPKTFGLIAEEVEQHIPELVRYRENGEILSVIYELVSVLNMKELQKHERYIKEIQETLAFIGTPVGNTNILERIENLEKIYNAEEENYNIANILKLTQSENGNIEILGGKIIFEGDGTLAIRKLKVEEGYGAGKGMILGASTSVVIETTAVSENSKVFVNPTIDTLDKQLYVTDIVSGKSFTVNIREAVESDITFDWFIVDSKQ